MLVSATHSDLFSADYCAVGTASLWSETRETQHHIVNIPWGWAARGTPTWAHPAPPGRGSRGGSPSSRSWGTPSGGRRRVTASAVVTWRVTVVTTRMFTKTSSSIKRMTSSSGLTWTSATTTTSVSNTRSLRTFRLCIQEFLGWYQPKRMLSYNTNFIGTGHDAEWILIIIVFHNLHQNLKFQNIHQHNFVNVFITKRSLGLSVGQHN